MASGYSPRRANIITNKVKNDDYNDNMNMLINMMREIKDRINVLENGNARVKNSDTISNYKENKICENQVIQYPFRLPRGGWLKNPFEEISFSRRNDPQNPIRFWNKFKKLAEYEQVTRDEQVYYFGRCMKGDASQWFELHDFDDIEVIEENFKEHYWGCQAQMNFRNRLYYDRFRPGSGSMAEYAMRLAREAKTLSPPMSDQEIIFMIKEHFDSEVARELRPSIIRSVTEMINMLETIENERTARRLRYGQRNYNTDRQIAARNDFKKTEDIRNQNIQRGNWQGKNFSNQEQQYGWKKVNFDKNSKGIDIIEIPQNKIEKPVKTSYVRDIPKRRENYNDDKRLSCLAMPREIIKDLSDDEGESEDEEVSVINNEENKNTSIFTLKIKDQADTEKGGKVIRVNIFSAEKLPEGLNEKYDDDEQWVDVSDIDSDKENDNLEIETDLSKREETIINEQNIAILLTPDKDIMWKRIREFDNKLKETKEKIEQDNNKPKDQSEKLLKISTDFAIPENLSKKYNSNNSYGEEDSNDSDSEWEDIDNEWEDIENDDLSNKSTECESRNNDSEGENIDSEWEDRNNNDSNDKNTDCESEWEDSNSNSDTNDGEENKIKNKEKIKTDSAYISVIDKIDNKFDEVEIIEEIKIKQEKIDFVEEKVQDNKKELPPLFKFIVQEQEKDKDLQEIYKSHENVFKHRQICIIKTDQGKNCTTK